MKRYRLLDQPAEMDEYEQGEYVRHEDAIAAILAERERCAKLALQIDNSDQAEWLAEAIRKG